MSSANASFNCRSVKGLLRKPFAPRSIASTAVALSARAETTRMRTAGLSATSWPMHSMPSMRGMVRSMVTTSGSVFLKSSMASSPLAAVPTTRSSSNCCERSMRRRMMLESSTIISLKWRLPLAVMVLLLMGALPRWPSGDRRADRLGGGQNDLEARELARVGADPDLAAERIDAARHDLPADDTSGVTRDLVLGGEAGAENQCHGRTSVHLCRIIFADQLPPYGSSLERVRGDSGAVILEHQLVAIGRLVKIDLHAAGILLRLGTPHVRRLDAVDRSVAQHLDEAVLDGCRVRRRHIAAPLQGEPEALGMILRQPLSHRVQRRRKLLHAARGSRSAARRGRRTPGDRGYASARRRWGWWRCDHRVGVCGRSGRCGGARDRVLEGGQAGRHLAHVAQVREQVIELQHHRQEIVSGELVFLLALADHVLERVHAIGHALEVERRGLALDGVQLAEQPRELLAELRVGARRLLEDRVDEFEAGFGGVEEGYQLQRVDMHHADHHVELGVGVLLRFVQLAGEQHARGDIAHRAEHVLDALRSHDAVKVELQV